MHSLRFAQQVDMKSEIANVCNFAVLEAGKSSQWGKGVETQKLIYSS